MGYQAEGRYVDVIILSVQLTGWQFMVQES